MTQPQAIPLLTEVVPDTTNDLPVLTDIAQDVTPASATPAPAGLPELQHALEAYIDTILAGKLQQHLATAQRQAIEQAITEMKNELPQLIRAALNQTGR